MEMRRIGQAAVAGALLIGGMSLAAGAGAAPGDVDPTFGTGGVVAVPGNPEAVHEDPATGKLYTLSSTLTGEGATADLHIRAFLADGSSDGSFGDGGVDVALDHSVGTGAITVDGEGRVLAAIGGPGGQRVWRFEADGDLDTSFGTDGSVEFAPQVGFAQVIGIGAQPDGDVVVGLDDTLLIGGFAQQPRVALIDESGMSTDTIDVVDTFTERGSEASLDVDGTGRAYVLMPDDGVLTVHRYTADLTVDTSYGDDGEAVAGRAGGSADNENWGGAIDVSDDGSAVVAGTVGTYTQSGALPPVTVQEATLVAKVTAAGVLDATFSIDGVATLARPSGEVSPVAVGTTGSGGVAVGAWVTEEGASTSTGLAWQLTAAGEPETGFSSDGRVETAAWPLDGAVAADGSRFYVLETNDDLTASDLRALSLVAPAPATVPGTPAAPTVTAASATTATVAYAPPASDGGSPVTGYEILVFEGSSSTPAATVPVGAGPGSGTRTTTVTGLTPATLHRFEVRAINEIGTGAASTASAYALPPFPSVSAFVDRQFVDHTSKAPTSAERNSLRSRIEDGTTSPAEAVAEVEARPEWSTLDPLTRLYSTYFQRLPDPSGLRFWLGKRRTGTSVTAISNHFAKSSEFQRTYSTLSNREFVELVYQNALGRDGDANGVNWWTRRLDDGSKTRGQVMVQFSESSEHKRHTAGEVNVVSVIFGMLHRVPNASDLSTWSGPATTSKLGLIEATLASAAYDALIPSS